MVVNWELHLSVLEVELREAMRQGGHAEGRVTGRLSGMENILTTPGLVVANDDVTGQALLYRVYTLLNVRVATWGPEDLRPQVARLSKLIVDTVRRNELLH